jgi:kynurenine formamidase
MPEQFLTVNGPHLSEADRKKGMIKTYSFTTDDDDAVSMTNSKKIPNHNKLLSANSLSIDSITNDDDVAELSTKLKKRKSRRRTEIEV